MYDDAKESLRFHRSTFCGAGSCVEVSAESDDRILVRDSKDPAPVLHFTRAEWDAFLEGVRAGEFTPAALTQLP